MCIRDRCMCVYVCVVVCCCCCCVCMRSRVCVCVSVCVYAVTRYYDRVQSIRGHTREQVAQSVHTSTQPNWANRHQILNASNRGDSSSVLTTLFSKYVYRECVEWWKKTRPKKQQATHQCLRSICRLEFCSHTFVMLIAASIHFSTNTFQVVQGLETGDLVSLSLR